MFNKEITNQAQLDEMFEWAKDAGFPYMGDKWTLNDEDGTFTVTDTFERDGEYPETSIVSTLDELYEAISCWVHDC